MQTPSSARRITRSHALSLSNNTIPISTNDQKGVSKSMQKSGKKQQDRSALFDITNDSPIVGLAMGNLSTPSSSFSKKRSVVSSQCSNNDIGSTTPGSGEALLRSQVKSLLQKVEEEGEILKFSLEDVGAPFVHLKGLLANSPMALLAPTPTNTPYVCGTQSGLVSGVSTPVLEQVSITKMVTEIIDRQNKKKEEESLITRSLLFDFYEKSEVSSNSSDCVSTMTSQGGSAESKVKFCTDDGDGDDDNASIWSLQVNASSKAEEGDYDVEDEVSSDDYTCDYEGEGNDDDAALDDLCEGLSKISVNGPKFSGKHTRFVYDSDEEEDCGDVVADSPPGVLRLKGLPTPKGKHLRFHLED